MQKEKTNLRLCMGSSCFSRGNEEVLQAIQHYIKDHNLEEEVDFRGHLCQGQCSKGPNLAIGNRSYHAVSSSNIDLILREVFELDPAR